MFKPAFKKHQEYYIATQVPADNAKGFKIEYVYNGPMQKYCSDEKTFKHRKTLSALLCAMCVVIFLLASLSVTPLNADRLVSLFTGLSFAAIIFMIVGEIISLSAKYVSQKPDVEKMKTVMVLSSLISAICQLGIVVAGIIFYVSAGGEILSLVVIAAYALCAAISIVKLVVAGKIAWITISA